MIFTFSQVIQYFLLFSWKLDKAVRPLIKAIKSHASRNVYYTTPSQLLHIYNSKNKIDWSVLSLIFFFFFWLVFGDKAFKAFCLNFPNVEVTENWDFCMDFIYTFKRSGRGPWVGLVDHNSCLYVCGPESSPWYHMLVGKHCLLQVVFCPPHTHTQID